MTDRPSIVVTGASGFIGSRVAAALVPHAAVTGTFFTNRSVRVSSANYVQCDLRDREAARKLIAAAQPQAVIHIAGSKDLMACERVPSFAYESHVVTTANIVDALPDDASFVYVSTDCVFDGKRTRYCENDERHAVNVYGRMKLSCEDLITARRPGAAIVRVSLVFGWQLRGQTSNTAMDVLRAATNGWPLHFPTTLFNTPIYVDDAARAIAAAALSKMRGVIHVAGPERLSRFAFARKTAAAFGIPTASVKPVVQDAGIRPVNSCLDARASIQRLNVRPRSVANGLAAMRRELIDPALAWSVGACLAAGEARTL